MPKVKGIKLIDSHPDIAKQFNPIKNEGSILKNLLMSSGKKINWICEKGHEWCVRVADRTKSKNGSECPACYGRIASPENCLATLSPKVAMEWNFEKNKNLKPTDVTNSSSKKVWWICSKGHEWQAQVHTRTGKDATGCPYCKGLLPTEDNNLLIHYPLLSLEWDYHKNNNKPEDFLPSSNKKVWWICQNAHSFPATIHNRTGKNKTGCPYCSGRHATIEDNLTVTHPQLIDEWDFTKNIIAPEQVKFQSNKKVWWICKDNKTHRWESFIYARTGKQPQNCPFCSNKKVNLDNCLATTHFYLIKEWDYKQNGECTPYTVTAGSNKHVWWICHKNNNHKWKATVNSRTSMYTGCPECHRGKQTSLPEQAIFYYLKKEFPDALNRYKHPDFKNKSELDIYIPSLNIGIEYDGHFHNQKRTIKKDENKNKKCKELDISLIRVRKIGLPSIELFDAVTIEHNVSKFLSLQDCIMDIFKIIESKIGEINYEYKQIKLNEDIVDILNSIERDEIENSICQTHPHLLKEWHYEKNKGLKPEHFSYGTHTKVWWKCEFGHEWIYPIYKRTRVENQICPTCKSLFNKTEAM